METKTKIHYGKNEIRVDKSRSFDGLVSIQIQNFHDHDY